jgi:hypothetical protein
MTAEKLAKKFGKPEMEIHILRYLELHTAKRDHKIWEQDQRIKELEGALQDAIDLAEDEGAYDDMSKWMKLLNQNKDE